MDKSKGCVLANLSSIVNPEIGQIYLCDFKSERFDINTYKALQYLKIENSRENISVIPPTMGSFVS